MMTLPITATTTDIINLLIEWTELLAKENYSAALNMFLSDYFEFEWTPELLEQAVYGYGCTGYACDVSKICMPPKYPIIHKVCIILNDKYEQQNSLSTKNRYSISSVQKRM